MLSKSRGRQNNGGRLQTKIDLTTPLSCRAVDIAAHELLKKPLSFSRVDFVVYWHRHHHHRSLSLLHSNKQRNKQTEKYIYTNMRTLHSFRWLMMREEQNPSSSILKEMASKDRRTRKTEDEREGEGEWSLSRRVFSASPRGFGGFAFVFLSIHFHATITRSLGFAAHAWPPLTNWLHQDLPARVPYAAPSEV